VVANRAVLYATKMRALVVKYGRNTMIALVVQTVAVLNFVALRSDRVFVRVHMCSFNPTTHLLM